MTGRVLPGAPRELPERLREKLVELVDQEEAYQAEIRAMSLGLNSAQSDSTVIIWTVS